MLPHKPDLDSERTRIQDLGGLVVFVDTWRVNGVLSVTRAIGDPDHKPYINAEPSLAKFEIDSSLDFLVLGCDGLFDQLTSQDIASHVFEFLCKNETRDPQEVIHDVSLYLSQMAIREGSSDNITSIVLFFKPFEQLVATGFPLEGETDFVHESASLLESAAPAGNAVTGGNTLPTTNGGHFPYTDFSELPVGTNFNLHSIVDVPEQLPASDEAAPTETNPFGENFTNKEDLFGTSPFGNEQEEESTVPETTATSNTEWSHMEETGVHSGELLTFKTEPDTFALQAAPAAVELFPYESSTGKCTHFITATVLALHDNCHRQIIRARTAS